MTDRDEPSVLLTCGAVWLCVNLMLVAISSDIPEALVVRRPVSSAALWQYREEITTTGSGTVLHGRILGAQSNTDRLPLVVFLHGAGERGDDNLRQLWLFPQLMATPHYFGKYQCILLAPQCPEGSNWSRHRDQVMQLIDQVASRYPVDRDRIYLTGLSMGGFGAWDLAAKHPNVFAALVPVCGGGELSTAQTLTKVPIWAVHGDADQNVNVSATRDMISALRQLGVTPQYSELPGVGHDSYYHAYDLRTGILDQMFQQRKNTVAPWNWKRGMTLQGRRTGQNSPTT